MWPRTIYAERNVRTRLSVSFSGVVGGIKFNTLSKRPVARIVVGDLNFETTCSKELEVTDSTEMLSVLNSLAALSSLFLRQNRWIFVAASTLVCSDIDVRRVGDRLPLAESNSSLLFSAFSNLSKISLDAILAISSRSLLTLLGTP